MQQECDNNRKLSDLVRAQQPLVHLLTNYVTVTDCVNALLAVGARAICSHAPEEAAQVTCGSDALVCNLGGTEYYDAMESSFMAALEMGIPIVIDPVGCGASSHRRKMCLRLIGKYIHYLDSTANTECTAAKSETDNRPSGLLSCLEPSAVAESDRHPEEKAANAVSPKGSRHAAPAAKSETDSRPSGLLSCLVVRGNYAEIEALISGHSDSPGLDDLQQRNAGEEQTLERRIMSFARRNHVLLIASGETDLCTDGTELREIHNGTPALRRITGAGCLSSAVLAAYLASGVMDVRRNSSEIPSIELLEWAAAAVSRIGIAGETALNACRKSRTGAGHFHMYLMDALSAGDPIWES